MKRYTREEILRASGASPEELVNIEAKRLVVPNRSRRFFGGREEYYTEQQLGVLRLILETRRVLEARGHRSPMTASITSTNRHLRPRGSVS